VLTPHEETDCYTVNTILRNLPKLEDFVVSWKFPLMGVADTLNPEALRRRQGRQKVCTDMEFAAKVIGTATANFTELIRKADEVFGMGRRTAMGYLKRLVAAGAVNLKDGFYSLKPSNPEEGQKGQ